MESPISRGFFGKRDRPDPSRVPPGCRFHPRCPIVASGEAERLGILDRCTGADLELVERGASHWAACHALDVRAAPAEAG